MATSATNSSIFRRLSLVQELGIAAAKSRSNATAAAEGFHPIPERRKLARRQE
jgi:hypothetical protein